MSTENNFKSNIVDGQYVTSDSKTYTTSKALFDGEKGIKDSAVSNINVEDVDAVYPLIEASHSNRYTGNCTLYPESTFRGVKRKDGSKSTGQYSFTEPYAKPVLIQHRSSDGWFTNAPDPIGRIVHCEYKKYKKNDERLQMPEDDVTPGFVLGDGVLEQIFYISDKEAKCKVLNSIYHTVSIGGRCGSVVESISGLDLVKASDEDLENLNFETGKVYDIDGEKRLSYLILAEYRGMECSYVIEPADAQAFTKEKNVGADKMKVYLSQKELGSTDSFQLFDPFNNQQFEASAEKMIGIKDSIKYGRDIFLTGPNKDMKDTKIDKTEEEVPVVETTVDPNAPTIPAEPEVPAEAPAEVAAETPAEDTTPKSKITVYLESIVNETNGIFTVNPGLDYTDALTVQIATLYETATPTKDEVVSNLVEFINDSQVGFPKIYVDAKYMLSDLVADAKENLNLILEGNYPYGVSLSVDSTGKHTAQNFLYVEKDPATGSYLELDELFGVDHEFGFGKLLDYVRDNTKDAVINGSELIYLKTPAPVYSAIPTKEFVAVTTTDYLPKLVALARHSGVSKEELTNISNPYSKLSDNALIRVLNQIPDTKVIDSAEEDKEDEIETISVPGTAQVAETTELDNKNKEKLSETIRRMSLV